MTDLHLPALLSNRFPFGQRNLKFASILALYFIHIPFCFASKFYWEEEEYKKNFPSYLRIYTNTECCTTRLFCKFSRRLSKFYPDFTCKTK